MPNPNLFFITVLLDSSGSMTSAQEATREGLNKLIEEQQKEAVGTVVFTLVTFDTVSKTVLCRVPLNTVEPLRVGDYLPSGMTALLDAMGDQILETERVISCLPEDDRPGRVLFITISDGEENSSRRFHRIQLRELMAGHRAEGPNHWDFMFIGANFDAYSEGKSLGSSMDHTFNYSKDRSMDAFLGVSKGLTEYRSGGSLERAVLSTAMSYNGQDNAGAGLSAGLSISPEEKSLLDCIQSTKAGSVLRAAAVKLTGDPKVTGSSVLVDLPDGHKVPGVVQPNGCIRFEFANGDVFACKWEAPL